MLAGKDIPAIAPDAPAIEAIKVLNDKNIGVVLVVDGEKKILGIVTDGDIRRAFVGAQIISRLNAAQLMTKNPICIDSSRLAADALSIMQTHEITALPIINDDGTILGLLHLHNLLGKGEFRFLV